MDYSDFIIYTVILGMEALARPDLRDKVVYCILYTILIYLMLYTTLVYLIVYTTLVL